MKRIVLRNPGLTAALFLLGAMLLSLLAGWVAGMVSFQDARVDHTFSQAISPQSAVGNDDRASFLPNPRFKREPAPKFVLTDQDGHKLDLAWLEGKVILVNFVFTRCREICLQTTRELRGLQQHFAAKMGKELFFLSITVDPRNDTPARLKQFGRKHHIDFASWRLLTGTTEEIDSLQQRFGVTRSFLETKNERKALEHAAATFVIDRHGAIAGKINPGVMTLFGAAFVERVLGNSFE
jgi:protein SCO1/2